MALYVSQSHISITRANDARVLLHQHSSGCDYNRRGHVPAEDQRKKATKKWVEGYSTKDGSRRHHLVPSWNHLSPAGAGVGRCGVCLELTTHHRSAHRLRSLVHSLCGMAVLYSEHHSNSPSSHPVPAQYWVRLCITVLCRRHDADSIDLHATVVSSDQGSLSLPVRRQLSASGTFDCILLNHIRWTNPTHWVLHSFYDLWSLLHGCGYWLGHYLDHSYKRC